MSLKGKTPPELKIQAVEAYQAIRKGSTEIIKELGIRRSTFQSWVRKYQMEGRSGLYPKKRFTSYPSSLKQAAVEDYLGGGGSLDAMCRKYGISSHAVLQQWITLYNQGHREFKTRRAQEESGMAEKKKLSYEENCRQCYIASDTGWITGRPASSTKSPTSRSITGSKNIRSREKLGCLTAGENAALLPNTARRKKPRQSCGSWKRKTEGFKWRTIS